VSLKISRSFALTLTGLCVAAAVMAAPHAAYAVDWAKVPAKKVSMMYPAQTSWERLMIQERHSGRARFLTDKNCAACHANIDEKPLGNSLVAAERTKEPTPIPNKPGVVDVQIKTARDAENFYVQLQFDPAGQPNANMDMDFDTKITMLLDDGSLPLADRAGCWVTCHDDSVSMAAGKEGVTKYLTETRTPGGRGTMKLPEEIDAMRAKGQYFEYWQARLNPGKPPVAVSGTIFEKRIENKEPVVKTEATQDAKGIWTVTLSRKLTGAGPGHKDIVPGKTYTIGFAIHAGHTAKRFHYVSFERTMVLDKGSADFVAAVK